MDPQVTAIVLNFRSPEYSTRCVKALLAQTMADRVEVLLMDNHSEDESIQLLRNRFTGVPRVRIIETHENIGYGRGNNFGMSLSRSPYILIINPDNELEPTGLERMVAAMEADVSIGILAPSLVHEDGTLRESFRRFPRMGDVVIKRTPLKRLFPHRMRRYLQSDADTHATQDVEWVVGACLLIRRSLIDEIGGFDPRFFLFFEDMDLCRRTWMAGKRVVYFPQVMAKDRKHRLSEGGIWSLLKTKVGRIHIMSGIKYFWKWRGQPCKAVNPAFDSY